MEEDFRPVRSQIRTKQKIKGKEKEEKILKNKIRQLNNFKQGIISGHSKLNTEA